MRPGRSPGREGGGEPSFEFECACPRNEKPRSSLLRKKGAHGHQQQCRTSFPRRVPKHDAGRSPGSSRPPTSSHGIPEDVTVTLGVGGNILIAQDGIYSCGAASDLHGIPCPSSPTDTNIELPICTRTQYTPTPGRSQENSDKFLSFLTGSSQEARGVAKATKKQC
jgi:hypothetical protein